ncbi:MAG: response regulator [Actinobacteria bacterium]|nr:response regulator [Actinomycetota bacterium]
MSAGIGIAVESAEKIRLLVATANPSSLNVVVSMLEQYPDLEVMASALDGEECLQKLQTDQIDILLTEINLPKISGVKIAEYLSLERPDVASIILADQNSLGFFRTAMLAGAMDFLTMPVPSEELAFSVRRVYDLESERRQRRNVESSTQSGGGHYLLGKSGKVVTVCSGKGGTGKSVISAFTACFLQERASLAVALADFDLQFGDLGVLFNVHPKKSLLDLLPLIDELDSNLIKSASLRVDGGPDLFLSPPQVEKGELITTKYILRLLDVLKETYDLVVVNTGPRLSETHLDLFDASDLVIAVVNQDISSLKACAQLKSVYDRLGMPTDDLAVVVNKHAPDVITLEKVGESLGLVVIGALPKLSKDELEALDGGAISVEGWSSEVSRAIRDLSGAVCRKLGIDVQLEVERSEERRSRWPRFFKG